jgi:hypothetical protein
MLEDYEKAQDEWDQVADIVPAVSRERQPGVSSPVP